ncbi:MAG: SagB/ThcOx family dehydrogenase [Candidatus Aegiribacteria sp.]|nr:SagB/ThcOx family dehydrogenase [Candidatus Aegiribacteria sp.]
MLLHLIFSVTACVGSPHSSVILLPEPAPDSGISIEEAIESRRSIRTFASESISLTELARMLHSAQGITSDYGFRAAPSAGATFPLSVFVIAENVDSLEAGIYMYEPSDESLTAVRMGYFLDELSDAALGQTCVKDVPAVIVITAECSITTSVYGNRGRIYVHMEAGHVSQNIYLQCTAMGLGTVAVGAFSDNEISDILNLTEDETPLYLMPVGRPVEH